ncbi:MAG: hypothetical protein H6550_09615 [Chitinophagales bacterium]|nr:hypothetical protein [Chitinophagales bacterium]
MSHDTHHAPADSKPGSSFISSIWFMLLLAGLFVAAVNFVEIMGHDDGGHGEHATEHAAPAHHDADADHEAHGHDAEAHEEAHH